MSSQLDDVCAKYGYKSINVATWRDPSLSILSGGRGPRSGFKVAPTDVSRPFIPKYKVKYPIPEPTDDEGSEDETESTYGNVDSPPKPTAEEPTTATLEAPLIEHDEESLNEDPQALLVPIEEGDAAHVFNTDEDEGSRDVIEAFEEKATIPVDAGSPVLGEEFLEPIPPEKVEPAQEPGLAHIAGVWTEATGLNGAEKDALNVTASMVTEDHTQSLHAQGEPPSTTDAEVGPTADTENTEDKRVAFAPGTPDPKPTQRKKKSAKGSKGRKKRIVLPAFDTLPPPPPPPATSSEPQADIALDVGHKVLDADLGLPFDDPHVADIAQADGDSAEYSGPAAADTPTTPIEALQSADLMPAATLSGGEAESTPQESNIEAALPPLISKEKAPKSKSSKKSKGEEPTSRSEESFDPLAGLGINWEGIPSPSMAAEDVAVADAKASESPHDLPADIAITEQNSAKDDDISIGNDAAFMGSTDAAKAGPESESTLGLQIESQSVQENVARAEETDRDAKPVGDGPECDTLNNDDLDDSALNDIALSDAAASDSLLHDVAETDETIADAASGGVAGDALSPVDSGFALEDEEVEESSCEDSSGDTQPSAVEGASTGDDELARDLNQVNTGGDEPAESEDGEGHQSDDASYIDQDTASEADSQREAKVQDDAALKTDGIGADTETSDAGGEACTIAENGDIDDDHVVNGGDGAAAAELAPPQDSIEAAEDAPSKDGEAVTEVALEQSLADKDGPVGIDVEGPIELSDGEETLEDSAEAVANVDGEPHSEERDEAAAEMESPTHEPPPTDNDVTDENAAEVAEAEPVRKPAPDDLPNEEAPEETQAAVEDGSGDREESGENSKNTPAQEETPIAPTDDADPPGNAPAEAESMAEPVLDQERKDDIREDVDTPGIILVAANGDKHIAPNEQPPAPPSPVLSKSSSHGSHKSQHWDRPHKANLLKEILEAPIALKRPHGHRTGSRDEVIHRGTRKHRSEEDKERRERRRAAKKQKEAARTLEQERRKAEEEERRRARREARRAARKAAEEEVARIAREEGKKAAERDAERRRRRRREKADREIDGREREPRERRGKEQQRDGGPTPRSSRGARNSSSTMSRPPMSKVFSGDSIHRNGVFVNVGGGSDERPTSRHGKEATRSPRLERLKTSPAATGNPEQEVSAAGSKSSSRRSRRNTEEKSSQRSSRPRAGGEHRKRRPTMEEERPKSFLGSLFGRL